NTGVSGAQFEVGNFVNMRGIVNQTGGNINIFNGANGLAMGANGGSLEGTYILSGGTLNTFTDGGFTHGGGQIRVGQGSTNGVFTFNLNGGAAWVQGVQRAAGAPTGGGSSTFNFDGGILKAAQSNNNFVSGAGNSANLTVNISQNSANPAIIDD